MTIALLADSPHLIPDVGEMRWREWAEPGETSELAWWLETTRREAGRDTLPVTLVAIDAFGAAIGAAGLAQFDIDERRDRSPWAIGVIVRASMRDRGIGARIIAQLEQWAAAQGYVQLWVATGGRAIRFYEKCGWEVHETIERTRDDAATVLTKRIT